MTVIGFTGTRLGMTSWQRQSLDVLLNLIKPDEMHQWGLHRLRRAVSPYMPAA
jgi:hypothetical protein